MRGKLLGREERRCKLRITPAHAGKTHKAAVQRVRIEDHPRACGENPLMSVSHLAA